MRKGAKMGDSIVRRPWGNRALEALRDKIDRKEDFLLMNSFCGSGKTLVFLDLCNELYRRKIIDMMLVFCPRVILCKQYEMAWKRFRGFYAEPALGQVVYRPNKEPLVEGLLFGETQDGIGATYQGLVSQPKIYKRIMREFSVGLCGDEAQILGSSAEPDGQRATQAAECFEELSQLSKFTMLGTGSPTRSDGNGLILCRDRYGPPDSKGYRKLLADVTATYHEGVTEGYLRPLEYELVDGRGLKEYLDTGHHEKLVLSDMESGMRDIIIRPEFWMPMVDKAMWKLSVVRKLDQRYCLLIGACGRSHARVIMDYIRKNYPDYASLMAISDDSDSGDNLLEFQKGRHNTLVTVGMAYIGYDHAWITVVLCLNSFRWHGWLDQFAFRGGRIVAERPLEEQVLWVIGPDDKPFHKWADERRRDAQKGLRMREPGKGDPPPQKRVSIIIEAELTGSKAMGMDPDYDVNDAARSKELDWVIRNYNLGGVPKTGLEKLLRDQGWDFSKAIIPPDAVAPPPDKDGGDIADEDRQKLIRSELKTVTREIDGIMRDQSPSIDYGWAYDRINQHFNLTIGDKGVGTVKLRDALEWSKNVLLPQVLSWKKRKPL
jgi:superfamily II DNA or RNA helicase